MGNDILVLAEHLKGALCDITFEMLGEARRLADAWGGRVTAILYGKNLRPLCDHLGAADRVLYVDHPLLEQFNPEAILLLLAQRVATSPHRMVMIGSTTFGLDLASGLSAKLGAPLVANCIGLQTGAEGLTAIGHLYGGKMYARIRLPEEQVIVSVLPGSFRAEAGRIDRKADVADVEPLVRLEGLRVRFERLIEPEAGDIDITQSPIVVAIGRGIQSDANIGAARELADALGGVLAASRPVVDQGWLPMTRQVGRSGMIVKPKLYLALGVSGAPEHVEGMRDSDLIIAVNTDAQAPIFNTARYGAVADILDFIPAMTESVRNPHVAA